MTTAYGIPVPRGVLKTWEASSMTRESGGAMLRAKGVTDPWGDPVKCVAWLDRFGRCRACVGHYANGRAVLFRADMNGKWKLSFGSVPRDSDASLAEDAKRLSPEGVAARAAESGIAQNEGPSA